MAITKPHPVIPEPAVMPDAARSASSKPSSRAKRGPGAYLSVFNIAMMTTVTVMSLRSLPAMATYGLGAVTMFVVPAVLFLIPTALVGAELATTWKGGVYVWVREAMSNRFGFVAIWLQWIQNVVWYPTQLAFIAASVAFMIGMPSLSDSGIFTAVIILLVYWVATAI
ncbi:MAG: APC family permease, partial [Bifidobacteriaceae bacterium]|nr:APC family permease [Bifidobacteriaceae bacterium]